MDNQTTKNLKVVSEQVQAAQCSINQQIRNHIGQYAILIEKRGRHSLSFFIRITSNCTGEYRCYNYEGNFRCCMTKYLDLISIFIGEQELIYLDS